MSIETIVCAVAGLAVAAVVTGCTSAKCYTGEKPLACVKKTPSSAFYKADGSMDQKAAKQAYYDLMAAYNYPIPEIMKTDNFWVADFLQEDFANLGMGGIFWINIEGTYGNVGSKLYKGEFKDQKYGYLGHDIFLLPGQVLPEHHHMADADGKGYGPKMETWHIRHGSVEFFSEYKGDGTEVPISSLPADERPWGYGEPWFKCKFVKRCVAGEIYSLVDPEAYHFMRAGKGGAIVSEYASYHNGVSFSKPGMEFDCTKAKK